MKKRYEIVEHADGLEFRDNGIECEFDGVKIRRWPMSFFSKADLLNAATCQVLADLRDCKRRSEELQQERDALRARVAELERALSDVGSVARNLRGCVDDELKSLRARIAELTPADSATIKPSS